MSNDKSLPPATSSFLRREMSKEDVIIQFFRPTFGGKINNTLEALSRLIGEAETYTKLGTMLQPHGQQRYYITPKDLADNLDEYSEIEALAVKGREFLDAIGYVAQRQTTPPIGTAPVGANVEIMPIKSQLPGEEALSGVAIVSKAGKGKV